MEQLLLHLFGDYVVQNNWMAKWKVRRSWPCFVHALTYSIPFALLTTSLPALAMIFGTHFLIDRWSLAKYLMTWKGALPNSVYTYEDGVAWPVYIGNQFFVYVAADNTFHLIINFLALKFL